MTEGHTATVCCIRRLNNHRPQVLNRHSTGALAHHAVVTRAHCCCSSLAPSAATTSCSQNQSHTLLLRKQLYSQSLRASTRRNIQTPGAQQRRWRNMQATADNAETHRQIAAHAHLADEEHMYVQPRQALHRHAPTRNCSTGPCSRLMAGITDEANTQAQNPQCGAPEGAH
jgi:hypothetical protein